MRLSLLGLKPLCSSSLVPSTSTDALRAGFPEQSQMFSVTNPFIHGTVPQNQSWCLWGTPAKEPLGFHPSPHTVLCSSLAALPEPLAPLSLSPRVCSLSQCPCSLCPLGSQSLAVHGLLTLWVPAQSWTYTLNSSFQIQLSIPDVPPHQPYFYKQNFFSKDSLEKEFFLIRWQFLSSLPTFR